MKELNIIQTRLNAPKNQMNKFGGYAYRSQEDILEAVKPLLKETETTLTFSDEIVLIGERYYVKATATLTNSKGESVSNTAYAREEESKKGMDASQLTGATSSYSRKYCLNGLFAIDDCKDADTMDNRERGDKKPVAPKKTATPQPEGVTEQDAIDEATNAKSTEELSAIWTKYKNVFPNSNSLKLAIANNPNNPRKK